MRRWLYLTGLVLLLPLAFYPMGCSKTFTSPSAPTPPNPTPTITPLPCGYPGPTCTPTATPLPMVYLALGDSISYGVGASGVSLCFVNLLYQNNTATYPADTGLDLSTKYPGIQLLNLAIPGGTSATIINNEMPSVPTGPGGPNFVTIIIGGNELINNCGGTPCDGGVFGCNVSQGTSWSYNFKSRLETQVVNVLKNAALYPRVQKIVIGNIYDPTDGIGLASYGWAAGEAVLAQYNARIAEVVTDTGSVLVDDYTPFLGHGVDYANVSNPYYHATDPTFWYAPASPLPIHPDDRGHYELKKMFWPNF